MATAARRWFVHNGAPQVRGSLLIPALELGTRSMKEMLLRESGEFVEFVARRSRLRVEREGVFLARRSSGGGRRGRRRSEARRRALHGVRTMSSQVGIGACRRGEKRIDGAGPGKGAGKGFRQGGRRGIPRERRRRVAEMRLGRCQARRNHADGSRARGGRPPRFVRGDLTKAMICADSRAGSFLWGFGRMV